MTKPGIDLRVNFDQMYEMIGMGFAISKIGTGTNYMDDLIHAGFNYANNDFNREAAAFAKSTGGLSHMFEWGTVGINRGRSTMAPNPMSEQARLWKTHFNYYRGSGTITFDYKKSVAVVPKPTTAATGIPQKILKRLKDHVFYDKAIILEEGIPVTIKPKPDNKRKLLFVPNLWKGEKGYTMYNRPTNPDVSKDTKGTFTVFFMTWWEKVGNPAINEEVVKWFEEDLRETITEMERKNVGRGGKPLKDSNGIIQRSERTVLKYLEGAAMKRLERSEYED